MTMTYQEQQVLQSANGRDAILNLTARHNRAYSAGNREAWMAHVPALRRQLCPRP